ncbi:MAG: DM13 domain-containing protein [Candidatus Nitrosomaritimum yanchengensis]
MKKSLMVIVGVLMVGSISAFALSPYFTESTIDEELPPGVLIQPKMNDEKMSDTMEEEKMSDTMEEEKMKTHAISYSGIFVGVGDGIHDAQGKAYTIPLDDGSNILRLENFKSTNGPDLYVYLSTDKEASEFINLGKLKANNGNQNYEIPNEVNLAEYNHVLIWCKAFGVLFGSAEISPQ